MRDKKSNNGAPLFSSMHIALLLLCAVLLSSYAINGLYARFVSENTSGSSARVIYFGDVNLDDPTTGNDIILTPGVTVSKKVNISFEGSEASTFVFAVLTPSAHWQLDGNTLKMVNNEDTTIATLLVANDWTYLTTEGGKFVFYKSLEPNVALSENAFFKAQNGVESGLAVPSTVTAADLSLLSGEISISIKAIAMQSNGFVNVTEAWASVDYK